MPTIGRLHHHKPGTEIGRLACSEQRSIYHSVSTTHASFAGEVQWNVSGFVAGGLWYLKVRNSYPLSQLVRRNPFASRGDLAEHVTRKERDTLRRSHFATPLSIARLTTPSNNGIFR